MPRYITHKLIYGAYLNSLYYALKFCGSHIGNSYFDKCVVIKNFCKRIIL